MSNSSTLELHIGVIYEVDPVMKVTIGEQKLGGKFFARFVGWGSGNRAVFERGKDFTAYIPHWIEGDQLSMAIITPLTEYPHEQYNHPDLEA